MSEDGGTGGHGEGLQGPKCNETSNDLVNIKKKKLMTCIGACVLSHFSSVQSFSSVQFDRVWLFATPWTAARQASLSITNSRSWLKLTSIESVMPSSHLILCRPLQLCPTLFDSMDCSPPDSSVYAILQARILEWVAISFSRYWSMG